MYAIFFYSLSAISILLEGFIIDVVALVSVLVVKDV